MQNRNHLGTAAREPTIPFETDESVENEILLAENWGKMRRWQQLVLFLAAAAWSGTGNEDGGKRGGSDVDVPLWCVRAPACASCAPWRWPEGWRGWRSAPRSARSPRNTCPYASWSPGGTRCTWNATQTPLSLASRWTRPAKASPAKYSSSTPTALWLNEWNLLRK